MRHDCSGHGTPSGSQKAIEQAGDTGSPAWNAERDFSASFSANGWRIVTASNDKTAKVWSAETDPCALFWKSKKECEQVLVNEAVSVVEHAEACDYQEHIENTHQQLPQY